MGITLKTGMESLFLDGIPVLVERRGHVTKNNRVRTKNNRVESVRSPAKSKDRFLKDMY
jgi:hypothetical protein